MRRGRYDEAVDHLLVLHRKHPEDMDITTALGDAYAYDKQYNMAEKIFHELSQTDTGKGIGEIKLGELALLDKKYISARTHFEKALQHHPESAQAMEGYIRSLISDDQQEKALEASRGFQRKYPQSAFVHDLLARVELLRGDYGAAEKALTEATRLDPKWLPAYYRIGQLYLRTGRVPEGIAKFKEAAEKNPDSLQTAFILGILYQQNNDSANARRTYQEILNKNPDFSPAANNLAYMMAEASSDPLELKSALDLAERAVKGDEPSAVALDTLGWIYFKTGKTDQALKYLNEARDKDGDNPTVVYHLATVLSETDRPFEAEGMLNRAVQAERPFPEKDQAVILLEKLRKRLGKS
jgi:tetratricopeptide (TPR) repeat protein